MREGETGEGEGDLMLALALITWYPPVKSCGSMLLLTSSTLCVIRAALSLGNPWLFVLFLFAYASV